MVHLTFCCDEYGVTEERGAIRYSCRVCNYDVCDGCYRAWKPEILMEKKCTRVKKRKRKVKMFFKKGLILRNSKAECMGWSKTEVNENKINVVDLIGKLFI